MMFVWSEMWCAHVRQSFEAVTKQASFDHEADVSFFLIKGGFMQK